jgi:hypothetical protein
MRSLTFKAFAFLFLLTVSVDVFALNDQHSLSFEAFDHCEAQAVAAAPNFTAVTGPTISGSYLPCTHDASNKYYHCTFAALENGVQYAVRNCDCSTSSGNCSHPTYRRYHYYTTFQDACAASTGEAETHWYQFTIGAQGVPGANLCNGSCTFGRIGFDSALGCGFTDANGNSVEDTGETAFCAYSYENLGTSCTSGDQISESNPGYEFDCTNVDCGANDPSLPPGGSDSSGSGADVPDQTPTDNSGDDDDSDPDTPGVPGSGYGGSGDIDGDGERDIDCNPLSNPDCAHIGSGSGSGSCDVQPSCSGDPVQCAILYQEWASMCYDGGEFSNPGDCELAFECEGDVLLCEAIRQERAQFCALFGESYDDPTDNVDWDRDLVEEAEPVDVEGMLDSSGVGGGSCPANEDISVMGVSFTLNLDAICSVLDIVRIFVILAGWLSAAYILYRAL